MKNIVIACDTYMPKASPNGICVHEVAAALKENGCNVQIVTARNIAGQADRDVIDGIPVFRIDPGYVIRELISTEGSDHPDAIKRRRTLLRVSGIRGALNGYRYPLSAPEQVKNYLSCYERLEKQSGIDVLVCCYHQIAGVAAGLKFKKKHPDVKLIVYTLDAISGGLVFPVLRSMKIPMDALKRWEKKIFAISDKVFVMESHREHYNKEEYAPYRSKLVYLDIPLVRTDRLGADAKNDRIHFVYTGSMALETANPKTFLPLLKSLGNSCVFDIYGGVAPEILKIIDECGVSGHQLILHGKVNHEMIDAIQKNADILVNFGNANPSMIPCKIFEYISTGKKILSFTHSPNDSSLPYLMKYPNALIVDENEAPEINLEKIKRFLIASPMPVDKAMLETLYQKNLASYFYTELECIS